jgi:hypothetical protein
VLPRRRDDRGAGVAAALPQEHQNPRRFAL